VAVGAFSLAEMANCTHQIALVIGFSGSSTCHTQQVVSVAGFAAAVDIVFALLDVSV
jgi:hypothetical protein